MYTFPHFYKQYLVLFSMAHLTPLYIRGIRVTGRGGELSVGHRAAGGGLPNLTVPDSLAMKSSLQ